ncbi:MAG TPA: EpsI family protein [Bryobacteraceae bacterium]|nr:EpsI family protein [Bryobacteraceae bacterium]
MLERSRILVPILLSAQALTVHWAASGERPPATPLLSRFPVQFSDWKMLREDPLDRDIVNTLHADELLSRTYIQTTGGSEAGLFVAWFQSQRAGASQPHSPQVCLPASGWTPQERGEITLDTTAGPITVNRYVVGNRSARAVVLYWYQTPRRVIAGEWAAKFWLIPDAIRDRRTDTALVRLVVWSTRVGDEAATSTASEFARSLYPVVRQQLPR